MRFPYHGAGIGLVLNNSILIGKRSKKPFWGSWSVPGGGFERAIDKDELSNAIRELREETGIDFGSLSSSFICKWTLKVPFFSWTTFYYRIDCIDQPLIADEFSELKWVSLQDVKKKHLRPFLAAEVRYLIRNS